MSQIANQTSPSVKMLTYAQVFSTKESRTAQIKRATSRLAMMLEKEINPLSLEGWAQDLASFSTEKLILAFTTAESTLESWPTVSKVMNLIFEMEYSEDRAWILRMLRRHTAALKPYGPIYGRDYPNPNWNEHTPIEERTVRDLLEPEEKAPVIPDRLTRAMKRMADSLEVGLERLEVHPDASGRYETASEAMRARQQLDRDFRQAWQMARMEELAK